MYSKSLRIEKKTKLVLQTQRNVYVRIFMNVRRTNSGDRALVGIVGAIGVQAAVSHRRSTAACERREQRGARRGCGGWSRAHATYRKSRRNAVAQATFCETTDHRDVRCESEHLGVRALCPGGGTLRRVARHRTSAGDRFSDAAWSWG